MTYLGIDIGGANLKVADGRGWAHAVSFPHWRDPAGLADALAELIRAAPRADGFAVTMTGELADCYQNKAEGVRSILDAVERALPRRPIVVYLVDGRLVSLDEAREAPYLAAASNWHALARFACRLAGDGLLLDIGSTTTDIVPLADGNPAPAAFSDTERLVAGELVYTGVGRTPICAVVRALPWRGRVCPVAAELFATTADAYLLLGEITEEPEASWTADGRPLTAAFARARLARMVCADERSFDERDGAEAAAFVRETQFRQLCGAVGEVVARMAREPECVVVSGSGEWLAGQIARRALGAARVFSLATEIGPVASQCGPAHALAALASSGR